MTTAIRIEHPSDGYGIFAEYLRNYEGECISGRNSDIVLTNNDEEMLHFWCRHSSFNNPKQDGLSFKSGEHYCAFKSVEQLQEWVTNDELKYIASKGYRVYKLELSDCQIGRDNIIFTPDHIIKKEDITSIFVNNN